MNPVPPHDNTPAEEPVAPVIAEEPLSPAIPFGPRGVILGGFKRVPPPESEETLLEEPVPEEDVPEEADTVLLGETRLQVDFTEHPHVPSAHVDLSPTLKMVEKTPTRRSVSIQSLRAKVKRGPEPVTPPARVKPLPATEAPIEKASFSRPAPTETPIILSPPVEEEALPEIRTVPLQSQLREKAVVRLQEERSRAQESADTGQSRLREGEKRLKDSVRRQRIQSSAKVMRQPPPAESAPPPQISRPEPNKWVSEKTPPEFQQFFTENIPDIQEAMERREIVKNVERQVVKALEKNNRIQKIEQKEAWRRFYDDFLNS